MTTSEKFNQYYENRNIDLRNQLVEENLYIAEILIRKYINKGVEYDDLYQVASLALISAVERFDPTKGFEFSSFATPTILGEIKKYFRDKVWSVKVPRRLKELSGKIQKVREDFFRENHRYPTVAEISMQTGISEDVVQETIESSMAYGTYSLNQTYDGDDDGSGAVFDKYTTFSEKGYDNIEYREIIENVYRTLSGTNRYIFKKRFINNKSQSEIASDLGVSQMTVSRAEKNIVEKIRKEMNYCQ